MDENYTHPAHSSRQKRDANLSLGPLSTRLPLRAEDYDELNSVSASHVSYLYGKSAPVTPDPDSRSPPRPQSARSARTDFALTSDITTSAQLAKSKSASHLNHSHGARSSTTSRTGSRRHNNGKPRTIPPSPSFVSRMKASTPTTDVLMRVGAIIASEAREAGGENWLVSRNSSTGRLPEAPEDYYALQDADEYTLARERVLGPMPGARSRRPSVEHTFSRPRSSGLTTPGSHHGSGKGNSSGSHSAPRRRRSGAMTPAERRAEILARMEDDYFGPTGLPEDDPVPDEELQDIPGPDFVGLNEPLDEEEDPEVDGEVEWAMAEAYVRQSCDTWFLRSWFVRPFLFLDNPKLFMPDDEEEEEEQEGPQEIPYEEFERQREERRSASLRRLQKCTIIPLDTTNDPPPQPEKGGWRDAAWLLTVISKSFWG